MGVSSFSVGSLVLVRTLQISFAQTNCWWHLWELKIVEWKNNSEKSNRIGNREKKQASSDTQELSVNYYLVSWKSEVSLYHHHLMQALILHTRYIAFAIIFSGCGTRRYFFLIPPTIQRILDDAHRIFCNIVQNRIQQNSNGKMWNVLGEVVRCTMHCVQLWASSMFSKATLIAYWTVYLHSKCDLHA